MENNISTKIHLTDASANVKILIKVGGNFMDVTANPSMCEATLYMRDLNQIEIFARDLLLQAIDAKLNAEKKPVEVKA